MDAEGLLWLTRGLGFVAGGSVFWMQYYDLKDRLHPEPRGLLISAFLLGNLAAVLGLGMYRAIELLGGPSEPGPRHAEILFYCLAVVGPVEEGIKFLVARSLIFRWEHFDEAIDGLIYSSAVAIGFASLESLLYLRFETWNEQLARALTSPLTQSLFSSLWGFGAGVAFFHARTSTGRMLWQALPLIGAMLIHGVYDYVVVALNAAYLAGSITLILWTGLIIVARRIVKLRPTRRPPNL